MSVRRLILRTSRRFHAEPQLRAVQRRLESPARRRNRRDDDNLQLLLAAVLAPTANCIDVGANVGRILRCICAAAPAGKHIAYEPLPSLSRQLRSEFPAVDVRQVALSNNTGEADFIHVRQSPSRSGLRRPDYRPSQTESLRIR